MITVKEQLNRAKAVKLINRQLLVHIRHDVRSEHVKMPLPDVPTDADIQDLEAGIAKDNGEIVGVIGDDKEGTWHARKNVMVHMDVADR